MKSVFFALAVALMGLSSPVLAETGVIAAQIGKPAPDFKARDTNGNPQSLSAYKGKTVVLEWSNPACPYVVKHYDSGNMQALQKDAVADGVVWLTLVSNAEGKEGYMTPGEANAYMTAKKSAPTARILDPSGDIGHLYGAKTTPHVFVIDPQGVLVYMGAIDDNGSFKPETIAGAKNYVREALAAIKKGATLEVTSTRPYGCSVKYAY